MKDIQDALRDKSSSRVLQTFVNDVDEIMDDKPVCWHEQKLVDCQKTVFEQMTDPMDCQSDIDCSGCGTLKNSNNEVESSSSLQKRKRVMVY